MVRATHQGTLRIGTAELPCFVLKDGTRLVSANSLRKTLGIRSKKAFPPNGTFLDRICHKSVSANAPTVPPIQAVSFVPPHGGKPARGYTASTVNKIVCDVIRARQQGLLETEVENRVAAQCEILLMGFAEVGLIALIDEATGYQEIRGSSALQQLLDKYLAKELSVWAKTFSDRFYQEMHRLKGWEYDASTTRRPGCVAHYTVDLIYDRLAPDLVDELRKMAPVGPSGHRPAKLHQGLSTDFGQPRLQMHIFAITKMMMAARSWDGFMLAVNLAFPKLGSTLLLPFYPEDIE